MARPVPMEPNEKPPAPARLALTVAYDGTGFRGFAAQRGQRTVAGVLSEAITKVAGVPVTLGCAGRTDAGVHARGQVVHVDLPDDLDPARLLRSLNSLLGPEVVVRDVRRAAEGFDARHSATSRRYRYLLHEAAAPDPLLAGSAWTLPGPLDLRAMTSAADALLGEHDFRALCRRPPGSGPEDPIVRRVLEVGWSEVPLPPGELGEGSRLLRFDIAANAFCHQMVRAIVGVLAEIGAGKRPAPELHWLLHRPDRSASAEPAPAHGLCLVSVDYAS